VGRACAWVRGKRLNGSGKKVWPEMNKKMISDFLYYFPRTHN
jgi:hypothetical protein